MTALNQYGNELRPAWRLALANVIGSIGSRMLDLSWLVVGKTEGVIDGYVYRASPGFLTALHKNSEESQ